MSFLCWLGLHSWDFRERFQDDLVVVEARCDRPHCRRYPSWVLVNCEPEPR